MPWGGIHHHQAQHGFNVMQCELELINDLHIIQLKIVEVVLDERRSCLTRKKMFSLIRRWKLYLTRKRMSPDKEEAVVLYKEVEVAVDNKKEEDADRDKEK